MQPLVSIIIPAYNTGRYLEPTIRSALDQTWPHTEVIVVDDGSTDGSLEVARRFSGPRLRVIAQPNRGSCAARNTGAQAARGDYLQFLDHDDLLAPEKIEKQLAHWQPGLSPRTLFMGEIARFFDTSEGERKEIPPGPFYHPAFPGTYPEFKTIAARDWLIRWWMHRLEVTPLAWLISRELMLAAGPWEERFLSRLDDFEFITRLLLAADKVVPTPGSRAFFRTMVAGSMSSSAQNQSLRSFQGQLFALNLCCDHLLAADTSSRARDACASLLMHFAYEAYPAHRAEADDAEKRARSLGATLPPCPGGRAVRMLAPLLGWRPAKWLQHCAVSWGYSKN
jgi:glycosyltransferase involved in cell wall biosynthesis